VLLQQLSAQYLDRFYAAKLAGGRLDGSKGLSVKTVRNIHALMHKALRDAERKQLVSRNVAANADPPKQTHRSFDKTQTWSAEQVMTFLNAMSSHRLYAAYLLAVTTDMRRGEILDLRWQDLDFDSHKLAVRQTVVSVAYEIQLSAPKTAKGRRSIPLDAGTLTELAAHRRAQDHERKLVGIGYADNDLVFAREDGRPIHPDLFSQIFDRTVAKLDVPRIRFHDLRHTHATLGLAAGGVRPAGGGGRVEPDQVSEDCGWDVGAQVEHGMRDDDPRRRGAGDVDHCIRVGEQTTCVVLDWEIDRKRVETCDPQARGHEMPVPRVRLGPVEEHERGALRANQGARPTTK
jgi:integrase